MALGFFSAEEARSPEAMALRQRLALQMMQQRKFPKNVGEGIADVGSALGERFTQQRLDAQMAALERASANRGVRPAALPSTPPAVPGSTDPASGAQSSVFPDVAPNTATATIPAATLTDVAQAAPPEVAAAPPVQDASVAPPQADAYSYPQTAAADTGTVSDAPPVGIQPAPAQGNLPVRNALAQQVMAQRQGGPQPNPMLAGQSPASMPSTFSPDDLGSPLEAANNRPIVPDFVRYAQAGGTGIKPSSAPPEPVSAAPMEKRPDAMEFRKPTFETPPRMADPGPQERDYLKAASDPMVLPSYQKQYAEEAARLAEKRKNDHDQALKAFETRNRLLEQEQARRANPDILEYERQKLADERAKRQYEERITKHLGGRSPETIETNLYKSRNSVGSIPSVAQSIARAKAVMDKMYTGPYADAETFLSQALPQTPFGFDPARGTATQQFKTAMGDVIAAHRAAVVGPGSQSGPELKLLLQTSGGTATLSKETIKESLDAAERLMVKTAIAHQKEVRDYAGNFDADRTRSVFSSFGVPGLIDVVPQRAIDALMPHATNEEARKDFDNTFHTPGLAEQIIQREMARRGRR